MKAHHEYRKGLWTAEEDRVLMECIRVHGKGKWNRIAKEAGLKRCGKSCRLRWMNYLCPAVKRGNFSEEEEDLIIRLHNLLGNRWALIAGRVPGRTDNQVKNHWNTHLSKKLGVKKANNKDTTSTANTISEHQEKEDYRVPPGSSLFKQPNTKNGTQDQARLGDHQVMITDHVGSQSSQEGFVINNNHDNDSSLWLDRSISDDLMMISPIYSSYDVLDPLELEHSLGFLWDIGL